MIIFIIAKDEYQKVADKNQGRGIISMYACSSHFFNLTILFI